MDREDCVRTPTPGIETKKRPRTSLTLHMPQRNAKRTQLRERACNFTVHIAPRWTRLPLDQPTFVDEVTHKAKEKWSDTEIEMLVEFLLFHSTGDCWPTHKQDGFWSSDGEFVQTRTKTHICRSGKNII